MQSEAYKFTGFLAVISALGFFLRWLQNIQILDEETGLAVSAPISTVVVVLIAAVAAAVIGLLIYYGKRYEFPAQAETALAGRTVLPAAFKLIVALLLVVSGVAQILGAGSELWVTLHRLCGLGTLMGAVGVLLLAANGGKPEKVGACRLGSALGIVFGGLWLMAIYKDAAADPVLWRHAIEVLAGCFTVIAFYYLGGYYFGEPKPRWTLFFCAMGGFLSVVSVVDDNTASVGLGFIAVGLYLLCHVFLIVENMQVRRSAPEQEDAEPQDG